MKVIVAGSRSITDEKLVHKFIDMINEKIEITEIVSGGASGVDKLGEEWARKNNIPCTIFPADWEQYGKSAGPIRNREMAEYADALIAIWDYKSRGTLNMITTARKLGLIVEVLVIEEITHASSNSSR